MEPKDILARNQAIADLACRHIQDNTVRIGDSWHLKFEAWTGVASLCGLMLKTESVRMTPDGCEATVILLDISTQQEVGRGEGYVGKDEPLWFGGIGPGWVNGKRVDNKRHEKRPDSNIRAFAQTRAGARACRMALGHVVTMMGRQYSATPVEEMNDGENYDRGTPQNLEHQQQRQEPRQRQENQEYRDEGRQRRQDRQEPAQQRQRQEPAKQDSKQPAQQEAKQTAKQHAEIQIGTDGKYPSGVTQKQLDHLFDLLPLTGKTKLQMANKYGDPRATNNNYNAWRKDLIEAVEKSEGGQGDGEA
jgi:hypothetical protein